VAAAAAYARAVTITPDMVAAAVAALQQQGLQCVVALGEADGELAYLYKLGVIDLVVTEDSDALITGCERVVFKLTSNGVCDYVQLEDVLVCVVCFAFWCVFILFYCIE